LRKIQKTLIVHLNHFFLYSIFTAKGKNYE